MDYKIEIDQREHFPKAIFDVEVYSEDENDKTVHMVSMSESYYDKLSEEEVLPEELIKASFMFLLEREPNTAILSSFDLKNISEYFPEFEKEIITYFKKL